MCSLARAVKVLALHSNRGTSVIAFWRELWWALDIYAVQGLRGNFAIQKYNKKTHATKLANGFANSIIAK